jgi:chromosome segregation ATPase
MSDDLTQKLPGDKEPTAPQDDDRISLLVIAVQSLSSAVQSLSIEVQSLSSDVHEVKARLEALEKTVTEHSFETKPIWERALAEIAATRAELKAEIAETKAELRAEMKDGFRKLALKIELLNEDSLTLRADQKQLDRRVEALESKTP